jgi:hypothetical protein
MANKIPVKAYITEGAAVALGEFEATDTIAGDRVDLATESTVGVVELAVDEESAAGKVVQSNDARLSDSRTPAAHAASHQNGGGDEVATATPAANAIPKAGAGATLATGWLPAATYEAVGAVELATEAEVYTGTATDKVITPATLAGSYNFGRKVVEIHIVPDDTDVDTTSGVAYLKIPQALHLMKLVRAQAFVHTAGTTGATTIQVRNLTSFPDDDALSSAISIASGDTVGTAAVGDGTHNQSSTDNNWKIYVTAQSTTKPLGLYVVLEFEL